MQGVLNLTDTQVHGMCVGFFVCKLKKISNGKKEADNDEEEEEEGVPPPEELAQEGTAGPSGREAAQPPQQANGKVGQVVGKAGKMVGRPRQSVKGGRKRKAAAAAGAEGEQP